ncbi:MAG TPA: methyltransferase [Propionibacteriaceae bacterium]
MTAVPDPVDRIILQEASEAWAATTRDETVVLDDATGALTVAAAARPGADRVPYHCDSLADELRVEREAAAAGAQVHAEQEPGQALLSGATVVLLRLPKSLDALDELAEAVARWADPDVQVLAGGRVKHMTRGMNDVLSRHFTSVTASLGQQKSRVLRASGPRPATASRFPVCEPHVDLGLDVWAHGGAFAGSSVDFGTRLLLSFLPQVPQAARVVVDLGCGTGVLATLAARQLPNAQVLATDDSSAACRSAEATTSRNGVGDRVSVRRAELLDGVDDRSVDLVLCNPPFHRGTTRDSDAAFAMFADAGRALAPQGELWTVYNSHLPYLTALRRLVGPTRVMGQNPRYVVTRSQAVHP